MSSRKDVYIVSIFVALAGWYVFQKELNIDAIPIPGSITVSELAEEDASESVEEELPEQVEPEILNEKPIQVTEIEPPVATTVADSTQGRQAEGMALAGKSQNVVEVIKWLINAGGEVWLDDGNFGPLGTFEVSPLLELRPVTKDSLATSSQRYTPRRMSDYELSVVIGEMGSTAPERAHRLLFLWPTQLWLRVQNEFSELEADSLEILYEAKSDGMHLRVSRATKDGLVLNINHEFVIRGGQHETL